MVQTKTHRLTCSCIHYFFFWSPRIICLYAEIYALLVSLPLFHFTFSVVVGFFSLISPLYRFVSYFKCIFGFNVVDVRTHKLATFENEIYEKKTNKQYTYTYQANEMIAFY